MFVVGDAGEGGDGFALRTGREDECAVVRNFGVFVEFYVFDEIGRHVDVTEFVGDADVLVHAASANENCSPVFARSVEDLLEAADLAGE